MDDSRPLNYTHEYQVLFIEPSDGSHVFGVQLGMCAVADPLSFGMLTRIQGRLLPIQRGRSLRLVRRPSRFWTTA